MVLDWVWVWGWGWGWRAFKAGFGDNGEVGEDEDRNTEFELDSGSGLELIVCEQQSREVRLWFLYVYICSFLVSMKKHQMLTYNTILGKVVKVAKTETHKWNEAMSERFLRMRKTFFIAEKRQGIFIGSTI